MHIHVFTVQESVLAHVEAVLAEIVRDLLVVSQNPGLERFHFLGAGAAALQEVVQSVRVCWQWRVLVS